MRHKTRAVAQLAAGLFLIAFIVAAGVGTAALITAVGSPWIGALIIPVFAVVLLATVLVADGL